MRTQVTLVLFDVDGTLLLSGGATTRCIRRAAEQVLGGKLKWGEILSGTLDHQIFLQICARSGIANSADLLHGYKQAYLNELARELSRPSKGIGVLPGVNSTLAMLSSKGDVMIGVLTGNFQQSVALKLEAVGLDSAQFKVSVFAEDGELRHDLVAAALRRLCERTGVQLSPANVIIVGDTPADVDCARRAGCRVLSVATGHYSVEQLRACGPDAVAADLRDAKPLMSLIRLARASARVE